MPLCSELRFGPDGKPRYELVDCPAPTTPAVTTPAPTTPAVTTPAPTTPAVAAPGPIAGRNRSLLGLESDITGIPGIRRVTDTTQPGSAPLFTNIADISQAARGFFTEPTATQLADNAEVRATSPLYADQRNAEAELTRVSQGLDPRGTTLGSRAYLADQAAAEVARDDASTRSALNLGIRESLRGGVSPQGLQALTQGRSALEPATVQPPDLSSIASLLNAQTNQARAGQSAATAQAELDQTSALAEEDNQQRFLRSILPLAVDPITQQIDPARIAPLLGLYTPASGIGGTTSQATANATPASRTRADTERNLRARGYNQVEIANYLNQNAAN